MTRTQYIGSVLRFELVDQIADGGGMILGGAEDDGFFVLVDLIHEDLHALGFAFFDLDDAVEIGFLVDLARLRFHLR